MNFEHKQEIKLRLEDYLKSKGINTRKLFDCFDNKHSRPSMGFKGEIVHCFNCEATYDIYSLIGKDYNLDTFREQYQQACVIFGLSDEFSKKEYKKNMQTVKDSLLHKQQQEKKNYARYINFYTRLTDRKMQLCDVIEKLKAGTKQYLEIKFKIDYIDSFITDIIEYNDDTIKKISEFNKQFDYEYSIYKDSVLKYFD